MHPEVVKRRIRSPLILQDNAGPHRHHDVKAFFTRHRWTVLKHPPYSPDLSPPDFDGFSFIKRPNKGIRFTDVTHLKTTYEMTINELNNQVIYWNSEIARALGKGDSGYGSLL